MKRRKLHKKNTKIKRNKPKITQKKPNYAKIKYSQLHNAKKKLIMM